MIEAAKINAVTSFKDNRSKHLAMAFGLMAIAILITSIWLLADENSFQFYVQVRLLPWIGATAVVLLAPVGYLLYHKKFDLFHPLVHACWFYWFPSFVIGGIFIATDVVSPYQMTLVADPEYDLIWTYIYIMLGFAGMTLGFYLPFGRWSGEYASRKLPTWDWQPNQVLLPAIVFLLIGSYFYISPFFFGILGITLTDAADPLSTLYFTFAFLSLEAGFIMAMYIFKARPIKTEHLLATGVIIFLLISRVSLSSSRGSILAIVILLTMAYFYSGRRISLTVGAIFGLLAVFALIVGMIYGTTFRTVKGTEEQLSFDKQVDTVSQTLDAITDGNNSKVLADGLSQLAERIDAVSSLAVVVSNYERLKPYEASYGLENNIYRDLLTSVIPRFLWADKPKIFDARAYSDLYFNFNGNSYALTAVGDLLRNFGSIGVPIGMLIVGIFLRFVYATLIENQKVTIGRATAYYLFLVSLSYEGFYGTIFIYGWRIFGIAFISFFLAEFFLIPKKKV